MRNRAPRTTPTGTQPDSRLESHYKECGRAIGGGLLDATIFNIRDRFMEILRGTGNILAGILYEPFIKGPVESFRELKEGHVKTGLLKILQGVRNGVRRTVGGVIDIATTPFKLLGDALYGGLRTAVGITGLVGLGGDLKRVDPYLSQIPSPAARAASTPRQTPGQESAATVPAVPQALHPATAAA